MNRKRFVLLLSLISAPLPVALGQSPDITLHSTVSGNREQPKVMYILPWQQPTDRPVGQVINTQPEGDLFVALDRDEFVRELNYRTMMNATPDAGGNEFIENLLNAE
jgi:hypothetical protein